MKTDRRASKRKWSTPAGILEGTLEEILRVVGRPEGISWEPRPSNTEHGFITIFIPIHYGNNLSGIYGTIVPLTDEGGPNA